jgi:rubrerythrin
MARKGRKQLAVQIKEESFNHLERIKEILGLSNAKVVEMLIENYITPTPSINTNTNINTTEEILRKILKEELSCINTNTNTHKKESTNINTNTNTEPIIKSEKETVPTWNGIELKPNERIITDEYVVETLITDEIPEWQKKPLTTQDFYGKVPEPHKNDTPMTWLCEKCNHKWDGTNGDITCPKCDSVYIDPVEEEKPFNPFL